LQKAKEATLEIFELIDSKSSGREYGQNPEIKGKIVLKNIKFAYPQRKEATILNDTSIVINPGETIALVGESGSGKSTIMALLEKFYEPDSGFITVDDIDIQDIDTNWLRKSIGYVTQEPKLFSYSLRENLVYGRLVEQPDGEFLPDVTEEEIKKVACDGNIHEFIEGLPEKYQTFAGEKGTQLSGGQKQRIAISRALLKNPKILLLDEATSALDATSERLVQESLDKARVGRTTLIIAHRLSTIKNADKILVFSPLEKRVVEEGTHASLIASKGIYYNFYQKQQMNSE
jgi:ATP-binding cassette subfamily B (MDR/TAP) protein 1